MAASKEKIIELRALLGGLDGTIRKECFYSRHLPCPIPKGVLIELAGTQKTAWLIEFLKENESLNVFWLEKKQTIFPTGIHQRGVALSRIVFGVVEDIFEASRKVIQSQAFAVVVIPSIFDDDKILKSLQLISEKSNTTVFLMAQHHRPAWPIHVQLKINGRSWKMSDSINDVESSPFSITTVKHKHGGLP